MCPPLATTPSAAMRRVFVGLAQVFVGLAAQPRNNRLLRKGVLSEGLLEPNFATPPAPHLKSTIPPAQKQATPYRYALLSARENAKTQTKVPVAPAFSPPWAPLGDSWGLGDVRWSAGTMYPYRCCRAVVCAVLSALSRASNS